jgi:hypothetical protein
MSSPEKIRGEELRGRFDTGGARLQALALEAATGGFEAASVEVVPPISEAARDRLRLPEVPHVSPYHALQPGPDGMMITGSPGA